MLLLLPAYAFPLGLSGHLIYFGVILLYLNFPYRASTTLAAMAPVVWFHSIFDMVPADFAVLRVWSVHTFFTYMTAKTVSLLQFSCSFLQPICACAVFTATALGVLVPKGGGYGAADILLCLSVYYMYFGPFDHLGCIFVVPFWFMGTRIWGLSPKSPYCWGACGLVSYYPSMICDCCSACPANIYHLCLRFTLVTSWA